MMLHLGVMLDWGSPFPSEDESHVKDKLGKAFKMFLLPMSSLPHSLALTPWLLPVHS